MPPSPRTPCCWRTDGFVTGAEARACTSPARSTRWEAANSPRLWMPPFNSSMLTARRHWRMPAAAAACRASWTISAAADLRRSLELLLALEAGVLCEGHDGIYRGKAAVAEFIRQFFQAFFCERIKKGVMAPGPLPPIFPDSMDGWPFLDSDPSAANCPTTAINSPD